MGSSVVGTPLVHRALAALAALLTLAAVTTTAVQLRAPAPLRLERLEALSSRLARALAARVPLSATLGGAALKLDASGRLIVAPARPRAAPQRAL